MEMGAFVDDTQNFALCVAFFRQNSGLVDGGWPTLRGRMESEGYSANYTANPFADEQPSRSICARVYS